MCGLVGVIGSSSGLWRPDIERLQIMMLINSMRGSDSTGMFAVDKKNNIVDYIKCIGGPSHLFYEDMGVKLLQKAGDKANAIFGHGRLATIGEISAKNAHPFQVGDITLIHNGTLTNFEDLKKRHDLGKVQVDSLLCAHLLNKMDPVELKREITGAYAFIWYDARVQKVFVMKNHERPLYVMKREENIPQYYIASDHNIFDYLCAKYAFKAEARAFATDGYYEFDMEGGMKKTEFYKTSVITYPALTHTHNDHTPVGKAPLPGARKRMRLTTLPGHVDIYDGVKVNFYPIESRELETSPGYWIIDGILEDDQATNVKVCYKGDFTKLEKEALLTTTVTSIQQYWNEKEQVMEYQINGQTLETERPAPAFAITPDASEPVVFMNGIKISRGLAMRLQENGCSECGSPLKIQSTDYQWYDNGKIYCLQCVPNQTAGAIGG